MSHSSKPNDPPDRRALLMGIGALAAFAALGGQAEAADAVGSVVAARGSSILERAGASAAATVGEALELDDILRTGDLARLDLRLGAATRLRLGAAAVLKIDSYVAGVSGATSLEAGPVLIDHDSKSEKDFTVQSPYGLLAARGTSFFAGPSLGKFGVFVRQGRVDLSTSRGKVTILPGYGSDVATPGDAPSRPKKWALPRVRAALRSVE